MGNERKFIPVLRSGSDTESIPTYLNGKLYVDLRDGASETGYDDLVDDLFGTQRKPPVAAARPRSTSTESLPHFHHPRFTSHLWTMALSKSLESSSTRSLSHETMAHLDVPSTGFPFRLSRRPSARWANLFVRDVG